MFPNRCREENETERKKEEIKKEMYGTFPTEEKKKEVVEKKKNSGLIQQ